MCRYFVKLKEELSSHCDTESTLQHLKEGTVDKVSGWEQLKRQVLTKVLVTLYSSTLLATFLSVQLTVVKATIVRTTSQHQGEEGDSFNTRTTKTYLSGVHQLLDVSEMLGVCEREVDRVFCDVGLDIRVRYEEVVDLISSISVMKHLDFVGLSRLCEEGMDEGLKQLVIVTMDILESQDFR